MVGSSSVVTANAGPFVVASLWLGVAILISLALLTAALVWMVAYFAHGAWRSR